ncbi:OPT family oligopeptide transporter [Chondromyces apiculatus]|uniref:Oligopeptide transporter, OPT family n=1 Tax=Chondromyces apiculatus DSM 436 TaxID=1192034 RepID=A0A017TDF1_9BACT|nr:OPT family oligopeptide transporter [Chondromyces apiculatus]EYF06845.1 Oligopeptide transporter, OPT family [Chondromyces apiculatus DSM 436]
MHATPAAAPPPDALPDAPPSPPDPERHWLATVYQRGVPQLTVRAVISGMLIGAVMCLSNLYVVLKTGWSLGVTVTACILAFALFRALRSVGLTRGEFSMLENNAMGSVASAAGYMTGGGNMAAIPALLVLTGTRPDSGWMFAWFAVIAALGVFAAIPIKRQLINIEALPFPTGTATAETIRSMHGAHGEGDKARLLGWTGLIGAVVAFLRDAKAPWMPFNFPKSAHLPFGWRGHSAADWTMSLDGSLILVGAGALMGFRTGWSLLLGAIVTYGVIAPSMVERGVIAAAKYKDIVQWTLWPGAAVLLASGLLSFAFQWKSVARSFSGLIAVMRPGRGPATDDPLADIECPSWWFPAGFALLGPVMVFLMSHLFGIPWWAGVVALPLALVMGVVAARVTGETDVTPTKALGPVTQVVYGGLVPGNIAANIMGANVTGGVGLHAADLLIDLKSGYLLGANPRQQLFAQFFGVIAGAAVVVPAFNLLVPTADIIGSAEFPAPAVQVWAGVSKALTSGIAGIDITARIAILAGLTLGIFLTLAERYAPPKARAFIPTASGLGIALVVPGANAIAMFIGALLAELVRRRRPDLAERATVPVASGIIAGESLMGIVVAILVALGVLSK